jgi:hypothetical protein
MGDDTVDEVSMRVRWTCTAWCTGRASLTFVQVDAVLSGHGVCTHRQRALLIGLALLHLLQLGPAVVGILVPQPLALSVTFAVVRRALTLAPHPLELSEQLVRLVAPVLGVLERPQLHRLARAVEEGARGDLGHAAHAVQQLFDRDIVVLGQARHRRLEVCGRGAGLGGHAWIARRQRRGVAAPGRPRRLG